MKTKIIYTRKIAIELRKQGFRIIETVVNEKYPQYDAYVFEETAELLAALTKLSK